MYKIKTSDFFNDKIDTALTEAAVIETISDDAFISACHNLYAVYDYAYKLEFCFTKDGVLHYVMVEESGFKEKNANPACGFTDDRRIFRKRLEKIAEELNVQVSGDTVIKTGNAQLYFDKGYLSSIYYFPEHSGHRP